MFDVSLSVTRLKSATVHASYAACCVGSFGAAFAKCLWHLVTLTSAISTTTAVVLNLFHCWDPLNATDVVWDPQVKIEKVCAPE